MKKYFLLHGFCVLTKGETRGSICDLQRNDIHLVPNSMIELISILQIKPVSDVRQTFYSESETFESYLTFLEKKQLGFYCEESQRKFFLPTQLNWNVPGEITNAIVDHDELSDHDYSIITKAIDTVNCRAIELRFFHEICLSHLENILRRFHSSCVETIHVTIGVRGDVERSGLVNLIKKYHSLSKINIGGCEETCVEHLQDGTLVFYDQEISSERCCGVVSQKSMCVNFDTVAEGLKYNTCLNKKMAIDARGMIKNCPSMQKNYGALKNQNVLDVIAREDFQDVWSLTKSKIKGCGSCEFRKVCIDCRAYLSDPEDITSKPLKCGYDPARGVWEDWRSIPVNSMAIKHYEL